MSQSTGDAPGRTVVQANEGIGTTAALSGAVSGGAP